MPIRLRKEKIISERHESIIIIFIISDGTESFHLWRVNVIVIEPIIPNMHKVDVSFVGLRMNGKESKNKILPRAL